jgi:hypothetical protein
MNTAPLETEGHDCLECGMRVYVQHVACPRGEEVLSLPPGAWVAFEIDEDNKIFVAFTCSETCTRKVLARQNDNARARCLGFLPPDLVDPNTYRCGLLYGHVGACALSPSDAEEAFRADGATGYILVPNCDACGGTSIITVNHDGIAGDVPCPECSSPKEKL